MSCVACPPPRRCAKPLASRSRSSSGFLYKGEFQSIPTLVFYDNDMNVLGVFHERAQKARDEIPVHMSPISAKMRDESLSEDERKKYMDEYTAFQNGPMWASWRDAEITECREIIEKAAAQK